MMDVSHADFIDDDFEEIMKDMNVVDTWMDDEDEAEETLDIKPNSRKQLKSNQDLKAENKKVDEIAKNQLCDVDSSKKKKSDINRNSSTVPIYDLEEKDSGSVRKHRGSNEMEKSISASREERENRSRDNRRCSKENKERRHYDRDGRHDLRDSRHNIRDSRHTSKEGRRNNDERYDNRDKYREHGHGDSRYLLVSPGRELGRRRLERSPDHYGGKRRDISKTLRDIMKDKEEKDSLFLRQRHNHPGRSFERSHSRSRSNSHCFSENHFENDFKPQAQSPSLAPPGISPGPSFQNAPGNFYTPFTMGPQGSNTMYQNDTGFMQIYNPNMGNPMMMPTGGYNPGIELMQPREVMPPMIHESYNAHYLAEPMQVMPGPRMYSEPTAAPILPIDRMPTRGSQPPPNSQEALDKLLADKSISLEDYLKLTTRRIGTPIPEFAKPRSKSVENKNDVIDRCQEALEKLKTLQLPNRLIVSHVNREPEQQCNVKYCSPLKRAPAVRYNFTTPAKNPSQQNKQLLSSVLTTIGMEKMLLPNKKLIKQNKNTRDAAVQTVVPLCEKCQLRENIETCSKETSIDLLHLTKSVHTQVIEKELANSKSIFTSNPSLDGPTISLSHMTPAQILASKLSTKAQTLKSQQGTNMYNAEMSRGFTRRQEFSQYEQSNMYDTRHTQDELFEQRLSQNDATYDQRRHHNQMHSQTNQLFDKRLTLDQQRYNPY